MNLTMTETSRTAPSVRPYAQVLEKIRTAGLRPTRQRMALAKLLFEQGARHVTAEKLHGEALDRSIRVSLATVYNTLHQFTGVGLLREIVVDPARSYFDTTTRAHGHFYYEDTGHLEDIVGEVELAQMPDVPAGVKIVAIDIIIRVSSQ